MDHAAVEDWVATYVRVWRTPGADGLALLFTPEASYRPSPWADPVMGQSALARFWEAERAGPHVIAHVQQGGLERVRQGGLERGRHAATLPHRCSTHSP